MVVIIEQINPRTAKSTEQGDRHLDEPDKTGKLFHHLRVGMR